MSVVLRMPLVIQDALWHPRVIPMSQVAAYDTSQEFPSDPARQFFSAWALYPWSFAYGIQGES